MIKLKDGVHDCDNCGIYPCTLQEEISSGEICGDCPAKCCRLPLLPIMPCEEKEFGGGKYGGIRFKDNGWCFCYDEKTGKCTVYEKRPIGCRIASCRFISEGRVPLEIKNININKVENVRGS